MARSRLPVLIATIAVCLAAPSIAGAATLYATSNSPSETGNCTSSDPKCSLTHVLNVAGGADDVQLDAGVYLKTSPFYWTVPSGVRLHGTPGAQRPVLERDPASCPGPNNCAVLFGINGAKMEHIRVVQTVTGAGLSSNAVITDGSSTVDDSEIISANPTDPALLIDNGGNTGRVRGSLIVSPGPAIASHGAEALNIDQSTIVSTGASAPALTIASGNGETLVASVRNSIIRNIGGGIYDLAVNGNLPAPGPSLTLTEDHNDRRPTAVDDQGGVITNLDPQNVAGPPIFAAPGNYREAANSPTINAGAPGSNFNDLDGTPFTLRATPDIGAYEFVPAAAGGGGGAKLLAGVKVSVSAKRKKGKLIAKVTCPKAAVGSCTGSLAVKQGKKKKAKLTKVKAIKPGKSAKIRAKAKKGKASITVTLTDGSGATGSKTVSKKLK